MRYLIIGLLSLAPLVPAISVQQQQSDTGVKKSTVQEHASPEQKKPEQQQQPEKPKQVPQPSNEQRVIAATSQAEKHDTYDPRKDMLYRAYLWFTIFGVPIALGGLGFIYWQTQHLGRQNANLERQLGIQQRSSRQWINVLGWRQHPAESMEQTVEVNFQIKNPTAIPLRLDMVMTEALGQKQSSGLATFLAPDNPFLHEFFVTLNEQQWTEYGGSGVVLTVKISVFFTDAFDNQWNQIFERVLLCRWHNNFLHERESRTRMRRSGPNDLFED